MFGFFRRKGATIDEIAKRLDGTAGRTSKAGQPVTRRTALQVMTVLACCDAIAQGCGVPRVGVFRENSDGRKVRLAANDPVQRLIASRPNEFQTSMEFREMLSLHAALDRAGLALKVKVDGRVAELLPIAPDHWQLEQTERYEPRFRISDEFGPIGLFKPEDVFYLPNRRWSLVEDLPAVKLARDAIGLSAAIEDSQSRMAANGMRTPGILHTEAPNVTKETRARIAEQFQRLTRGANAFKVAVLDNGYKFQQMSMSGVDAQLLQTRHHQIEEICRAFAVFPQMVMHTVKTATFASAEAFFAAHTRYTLARWHELWRSRLDEFVLDGSGPLFVEFDTSEMTRASLKDSSDAAIKTAHLMTLDEQRDLLFGLDPIGDERGGDLAAEHLPNAAKAPVDEGSSGEEDVDNDNDDDSDVDDDTPDDDETEEDDDDDEA